MDLYPNILIVLTYFYGSTFFRYTEITIFKFIASNKSFRGINIKLNLNIVTSFGTITTKYFTRTAAF